ncbi:MAG: D-lyxose/D-mannose family sugar isomerase [Candidatus Aminicenantes bacterium]
MKEEKRREVQERAFQFLKQAHIFITGQEKQDMEVADCGLDDIERLGLQAVIYVNNDRYCAKELILFPRQMFPEHRHPPINGTNPGKRETFRCRWGEVFLYVEGTPTPDPRAKVPEQYRKHLSVFKEIVLRPGGQYTLEPNSKHWFQAGEEGAVVSEFSSSSVDDRDLFTDPEVQRIPVIE